MTDERDNKAQAAEYVLGLLEGEAKMEAERGSPPTRASPARSSAGASALRNSTTPSIRARPARRFGTASKPRLPGSCRASPQPSVWSRLWSDIAVLRAAALGASLAALMLAVGPELCDPPATCSR